MYSSNLYNVDTAEKQVSFNMRGVEGSRKGNYFARESVTWAEDEKLQQI